MLYMENPSIMIKCWSMLAGFPCCSSYLCSVVARVSVAQPATPSIGIPGRGRWRSPLLGLERRTRCRGMDDPLRCMCLGNLLSVWETGFAVVIGISIRCLTWFSISLHGELDDDASIDARLLGSTKRVLLDACQHIAQTKRT